MDAKLRIEGGNLVWGMRVYGPATALYCDPGELRGLGPSEGVVHTQLPHRLDYVLCYGDKVLGGESKTPSDLWHSYVTRKLPRQLRNIAHICDVAFLMLRGGYTLRGRDKAESQRLWEYLVQIQVLGIILLPGPTEDVDVPPALAGYATWLAGAKDSLSALAGREPVNRRRTAWYLRQLKYVGQGAVDRLGMEYDTVLEALNASDEEWRAARIPQRAIDARNEAVWDRLRE